MQRVADRPGAPPRSGSRPRRRRPPRTDAARAGPSTAAPAGRNWWPPPWRPSAPAGPDFAVDDVARSAGVSKTVIYRYFTDKDELVDAVLERISDGRSCCRGCSARSRVEHADDRARAARGHRRVRGPDRGRAGALPLRLRPRRPLGRADLVAATEHEIAEALAAVMSARLADAGRATGAAARPGPTASSAWSSSPRTGGRPTAASRRPSWSTSSPPWPTAAWSSLLPPRRG